MVFGLACPVRVWAVLLHFDKVKPVEISKDLTLVCASHVVLGE